MQTSSQTHPGRSDADHITGSPGHIQHLDTWALGCPPQLRYYFYVLNLTSVAFFNRMLVRALGRLV